MKRTLGGMIISLSDSEAALTLPSPQRDNISQCEIGSAEIAYEACILRFIVAGTNTHSYLQSFMTFFHHAIWNQTYEHSSRNLQLL